MQLVVIVVVVEDDDAAAGMVSGRLRAVGLRLVLLVDETISELAASLVHPKPRRLLRVVNAWTCANARVPL